MKNEVRVKTFKLTRGLGNIIIWKAQGVPQ